MEYYLGYGVYIIALFFASAIGLYRFRQIDKGSKILTLLVCCTLIVESAAYFFAKKYHNNILLYSFFALINYNCLCFYFNNVIDVFNKRNVGIFIALFGTLFGLTNLIFIQGIDKLNSYFLLFDGISVIAMSLFALFRLLLNPNIRSPFSYHHFWFTSILLIYWCITYLNWGLLNYINMNWSHVAFYINFLLFLVNAITYGAIGLILLIYPKLQQK